MKKYIIFLFLVHAIHAYGQPKSKMGAAYYDHELNRCALGQIIVLKVTIYEIKSHPGNWAEVANFLIVDTKKNEVTSYSETQFDRKGGTKQLAADQKKSFLSAFYKISESQTADLPYEQSIVVAIRSASGVKIKKYAPSKETDALYNALMDEWDREYFKKRKQENTKTEPNHTLQRTSTAVTNRAAHAPRQLLRSLT